ncbi:unnamed protein product [Aphanomyces euteiches]
MDDSYLTEFCFPVRDSAKSIVTPQRDMREIVAAFVAVGSAATAALRQCCQFGPGETEYELLTMDVQSSPTTLHPSNLTIGRIVGSGAFSTVFKATLENRQVALKCQNAEAHAYRERDLLKQLHHPNLSRFLGSREYVNSMGTKELWLVTEYMAGGDLSNALTTLSWTQCIQVALDSANALHYLHENHVVHRDIKSSNILLSADNRARICDFGFAREIVRESGNGSRKRSMTLCGTDAYMAPEIYFEEEYDERVDIFSLGVVLIELICRRKVHKRNFLMRTPANHFVIDVEAFRQAVSAGCPSSFVCLAEMCVAANPDDRPSALEIVEWLQDLKRDLDSNPASDVDTVCSEDAFSTYLSFEPSAPPQYEGILLMRPSESTSLWREMRISMRDSALTIVDDSTNSQDTWALADCSTIPEAKYRHWLIDGKDCAWECQAKSLVERELWVAFLNHGIQVAMTPRQDIASSIGSENDDASDEVHQWLSSLGLSHYFGDFKAKGFSSLDFLRETGLEEDDFCFLGIESTDDQAKLSHAVSVLREN